MPRRTGHTNTARMQEAVRPIGGRKSASAVAAVRPWLAGSEDFSFRAMSLNGHEGGVQSQVMVDNLMVYNQHEPRSTGAMALTPTWLMDADGLLWWPLAVAATASGPTGRLPRPLRRPAAITALAGAAWASWQTNGGQQITCLLVMNTHYYCN